MKGEVVGVMRVSLIHERAHVSQVGRYARVAAAAIPLGGRSKFRLTVIFVYRRGVGKNSSGSVVDW